MKKFLFILACLSGLSCGKAKLEFISPGEGQSFPIEQMPPYIDFNVSNNEFDGITIEFRGAEAVSNDIQCDNTSNSPLARCTSKRAFNGGMQTGGFAQGCDQAHPCSVVALLYKNGELLNTRTIRFTRGGAVAGPK